MVDRRTRFWHPVENARSHEPRSIIHIARRGHYEVLVCGLHEVLVRRLTFWEVTRRVWAERARRRLRSLWRLGPG